MEEISRHIVTFSKVVSRGKLMLPDNPVVGILKDKITEFQQTLPVGTRTLLDRLHIGNYFLLHMHYHASSLQPLYWI